MTRIYAVLAIAVLLLPLGAGASSWLGMLGKLSIQGGFEGSGIREDGKVQWEIAGRQLRKEGLELKLEGYRLLVRDREQGETLSLESPRGLLYPAVREIRGDAPIIIKGKGISISGIGYDVYLEQRVFQIRSNVMVKVSRGSLKKTKERVAETRLRQYNH